MIQLGIGEKIRSVRRSKRMTQKKLADKVGCESSFVSHIERNSRNMSLDYLRRIADALDTPAYRLMTGENDRAALYVSILLDLDEEHFEIAAEFLDYLRNRQAGRSRNQE